MKKLKSILLLAALMTCVIITHAQNENTSGKGDSKWAADKGYWVIESNIKTPKNSIVRFYTLQHEMIYAERVEGIQLNVKKRKTAKKLNILLDKLVYAWERDGVVQSKGELLAVLGHK